MSKIYILILSMMLITGTAYAEKEDDHSAHDHGKKSKHADDDDHKGHDNLENHDDHKDGEDHGKHEGHDEHKEKGGHEGHDEHGGGKAVGKGKAIEAVDEVKGFKLSKEAIKTLELKLQTVDGDEFIIEKSTLVASKSLKGLYRFRGGFFKFLPIKLLKEVDGKYLVKVKGVDFGDQIVTNGVGLLRVTDVYSTDKSEYGHGH